MLCRVLQYGTDEGLVGSFLQLGGADSEVATWALWVLLALSTGVVDGLGAG